MEGERSHTELDCKAGQVTAEPKMSDGAQTPEEASSPAEKAGHIIHGIHETDVSFGEQADSGITSPSVLENITFSTPSMKMNTAVTPGDQEHVTEKSGPSSCESSSIVQISGIPENTHVSLVQSYFESKKRSNGGVIEHIELKSTCGIAFITYKDVAGIS